MSKPPFGWFQLLDSTLPIGGFAHSFGLETAVHRGSVQTIHDLKQYIHAQLAHSWVPLDLAVLREQRFALEKAEYERFLKWDKKLNAQRLAKETRDGQRKMGRQLLQLAARWDEKFETKKLQQLLQQHAAPGMHLSIYTWLTHHWGIPILEAGQGYLYSNCSMTIQAAIRLISIGQMDGQTLLYQLHPEIERNAKLALSPIADSTDPVADGFQAPHSWAWMQEIDAMAHEGLYSRLFMS